MSTGMPRPRPVLLLAVAVQHLATVEGEFSRYARDYEVVAVGSAGEARSAAERLAGAGRPVALLAVGWVVPGVEHGLDLMDELHATFATARRVCLTARDDFGLSLPLLREALAQGRIDTYLLIPQGPRDEEFHTAVVEYLSD